MGERVLMEGKCVFCSIVGGRIPSYKIYEDEVCFMFLDINPCAPGHTLLIPKAHSSNLMEMDEETFSQLAKRAHRISPAILQAVGAKAFNLVSNVGKDSGQEVFHTHLHIIPRAPGSTNKWKGSKATQEQL